MSVDINFNVAGLINRADTANSVATLATSQQALKDCNFYCKEDFGILIDSSINNSDLENGLLIWDTLYAQKQYYLEAAHTDKNPNAQMMWGHKAKDVHMDEWEQVFQAAYYRGWG